MKTALTTQLVRRVWDSPTANSWLSLLSRPLSFLLVIPLVLNRLPDADAAIWFLFSTLIIIQSLIAAGFIQNFARLFSYAKGGSGVKEVSSINDKTRRSKTEIDWQEVRALLGTTERVFWILAAASFFGMAVFGTLSLRNPISASQSQAYAWIAWSLVVIVTSISLGSNTYICYLQGVNHIAIMRRWEALTSILSIFSSFLVLLVGGGLLALVVSNQVWSLVSILVMRHVFYSVDGGVCQTMKPFHYSQEWFKIVWPNAWKTGLAGLATHGWNQASGVMLAQAGDPVLSATYIFFLRLASTVAQVSQAPFQSKLPEAGRLRAQGKIEAQRSLLRRGMFLAHWMLVLTLVAIGIALPVMLHFVKSRSVVYDPILWAILALNIFFERWGGMLQQVRNLANRSVEHIGAIGYLILNVTLSTILIKTIKIYAFPTAMLATQILFSMALAIRAAYPTLEIRFWTFEKTLAFPALATLLAFAASLFMFGSR